LANQGESTNVGINNENNNINNLKNTETDKNIQRINVSLDDLRKKLNEVDNREQKDYKHLLEELNNIKQQLKTLKA
jgi:hypothetical protein